VEQSRESESAAVRFTQSQPSSQSFHAKATCFKTCNLRSYYKKQLRLCDEMYKNKITACKTFWQSLNLNHKWLHWK